MASVTSPPRAQLAFRVGVVGHRPDRLKDADPEILGNLIHEILETVQKHVNTFASSAEAPKFYSPQTPLLRAITPLAEGTDRLFADKALDLHYQICCPMPFAQAEYEKDFSPANALEDHSLERFHAILKRAREETALATFELDGDREQVGDAYGAAGRIVLNQSDLLVVVWDGGLPKGGGGTVQTLKEAVRHGVPVLWIDAVQPHPWQVLSREDDLKGVEGQTRYTPNPGTLTLSLELESIVNQEIAAPPAQEKDAVGPADYFGELKPSAPWAVLWKFFRDAVGSGKFKKPSIAVEDFETAVAGEWPVGAADQVPKNVAEWTNRYLRPHYAWADKLADLYADAYRSTYVFIYLAAAAAVFLALLPMASNWLQQAPVRRTLCTLGELAILLTISILLLREKNNKWHKRWIAYRLAAEMLRQLRCLVPLGGGRPLGRAPAHLATYGDPKRTWIYWHLRGVAREIGIPSGVVNPAYAANCLSDLAQAAGTERTGQLGFHLANSVRSKNIAHRLHETAEKLFWITVGCIVIHLIPDLLEIAGCRVALPEALDRWLILACATFPAIASALAGINNQSDFARIARQSHAMAEAFKNLNRQITVLTAPKEPAQPPLKLADVTPLATQMTQLMVDEVLDWRVVFMERPPIDA
ncbi:MAG TPA: DUF4231 domain-containing protein [Bryobacteraceae bacterium]|jgi:hypothetical protein